MIFERRYRARAGSSNCGAIPHGKGTVDRKASDLNGNGKPDLGKNK